MDKEVAKQVKWIKKVLGDRLGEADEPMIQMTAQLIVLQDDLFRQVSDLNGEYITFSSNGVEMTNPIFTLWMQISKQLLAQTNKLGLNPVSRKENLKAEKEEKVEIDPFDESE